MAEPWSMSESERLLLNAVFDWIQKKIMAGEGFSVLLASEHPSGMKLTKVALDSVESGIAQCRVELQNELHDATAYALAYDAWHQATPGAKPRPVFMFQCERAGGGTAMRLGHFYRITKALFSSQRSIILEENLQLVGPQASWLK